MLGRAHKEDASRSNAHICFQRLIGVFWSRYSLTYWKSAIATLDSGSRACEIYAENINRTNSGEFKTKITSLMVSSDPHSFIESWAADE